MSSISGVGKRVEEMRYISKKESLSFGVKLGIGDRDFKRMRLQFKTGQPGG